MPDWQRIAGLLAGVGLVVDLSRPATPKSGGDISAAWRLPAKTKDLFVKTGPPGAVDMFRAEYAALEEIADVGAVRVPVPLLADDAGDCSFLALEWLQIGPGNRAANGDLGRQLAALHRHCAPQFGWHLDNTIGRTPQPNPRSSDWQEFFREHRLQHQLALAAGNGYRGELQQQGAWLCQHLDRLFGDYQPQPSLLHGDLWGGNWGVCNGQPVIFDPASYYGDRETDLAMTRLFGGFGAEFYAAYEESWPLDRGASERVALYQLYHVLNHLNLFGGGYQQQALTLMARLRHFIERQAESDSSSATS